MNPPYADRLNDEIIRPLYAQGPTRDRKATYEPKRYKKGDCLICKKGRVQHLDWPERLCPVCGGTGRYPKEIMERRQGDNVADVEGEVYDD